MKRFSVRISDEMHKRIRKLAIDLDMTVNEVLVLGFEKLEQQYYSNKKESKQGE